MRRFDQSYNFEKHKLVCDTARSKAVEREMKKSMKMAKKRKGSD